ncbi:hypothetical protein [Paenibacillus eucommiae]|uniref:Flagellar hook-length control protein FliK n=1 Tax=Paenibacillus eucommiae TaxID=1355755 RepID=A0ABS4IUU2_9BACL|nr:hypothetical protein [Paenibacillus eucommiae]MBP1991358.1 hypothetical protein [Paenibacillus eucommiae]
MNVSGLIRSLMGELQASDSKTLELKVGQIVKGLVLQLLSDQDALINIGGVQVRAKLETPLMQGDIAMLQVQPESNGSQVVLKPLISSDVQIAEESMKDLLKSFGLKDIPQNRQMLQQIQQEGVPLTKETVKTFAALQSAVPAGVNKQEWTQAAVLAFKRNLPLTMETVAALRQATAGPPVGDVLESLEQQAASVLKEQPSQKAAATLTQLLSVITQLRASAAAAWTARPPEQATATASTPAAAQAGDPAKASATGGTPQGPGSGAAAPADARLTASPGEAAGATPAAQRAEAERAAAGLAKPAVGAQAPAATGAARAAMGEAGAAQAQGAEPEAGGEPQRAGSPREQPAAAAAGSAAPVRAQAEGAGATPPAAPSGAQQAAEHGARPAAQQESESNWIGKLLKSFGVEHEHQLSRGLQLHSSKENAAQLAFSQDNLIDGADRPATETLKSLLLQLSTTDDLPAPLKELSQQALQQITGQQLLLSTDRNSMFSHVTLFVPFLDGSGQQSAAVHIQSRKGKRGEVDASNCRLLFDLHMKAMGNTLVDVQVVNKIVSLQVHNDHPLIGELIEGSREEIAASLAKVGYQFFSLKCMPYPQLTAAKESDSNRNGQPGQSDGAKVDLKSMYEPKPYKGVDYRI